MLENIIGRLRDMSGSKFEPMITMFTEVHSKTLSTDLGKVLQAVNYVGLKTGLPKAFNLDKAITRILGLHEYDANWPNYDALYLSEAERKRGPKRAFIATTIMSSDPPSLFEEMAFKDPIFGELMYTTL